MGNQALTECSTKPRACADDSLNCDRDDICPSHANVGRACGVAKNGGLARDTVCEIQRRTGFRPLCLVGPVALQLASSSFT